MRPLHHGRSAGNGWPRRLAGLAFAIGAAFVGPAAAEHDDLIHADLPLWTEQYEQMWPRAFHDKDSFGCAHTIRLGDWRLQSAGKDDPDEWLRLENYGVMHCYLVERRAYVRAGLTGGGWRYSVIVQLGRAPTPKGEAELWALQSGARPGSDYLLLATPAKREGVIAKFDVLRRECPSGKFRDAGAIDILLTGYCAIDTRDELVKLARRMAGLPPLAVLEYVGEAPKEAEE